MKKLIMTIGAPGSGKSTWADEQLKRSKSNSHIVNINRDDIRSMLFAEGYKYTRGLEDIVATNVKTLLADALQRHDVSEIIISDTNLSESTRNGYKKIVDDATHQSRFKIIPLKVEIEYKTFDVPWVELVKRNEKRGAKAVPAPVLRSMFLNMQKYLGKHKKYTPDAALPKAVIFDLDGTLANNDHRKAFDYAELINDKPIEWVVDILKNYADLGYAIICVSGRNAGNKEDTTQWLELTIQWLIKHNIPFTQLCMRDHNDSRSDDIVKEEIFWDKIANDYNVVAAYDDRDRVVEMWRRIGVNCAQVNFGEF